MNFVLIITIVALIVLEMLYFSVAKHFHIVDRPNDRSSHRRVTLLGAGVIFYLAILMFSLTHRFSYFYFLLGATILAVVSYIDDLRRLPSWFRLLAQVAAIALSFYFSISTLQIWQMILLVMMFAGVLNVYNFMDGVNGMLAAYSLVVVGTFSYINIAMVSFVSNDLLILLLVAILIFGFFNFRKNARCFSGDVGSIVMGFTVLFLLIRYDLALPDIGENVSYLCFIIVFLADGLLTIAKRFLNGRNILEAHREHMYETLVNDLHVPHLWVSAGYAVLQLIVNIGYLSVSDKNLYTFLVATVLVVSYGLFFFYCNRRKECGR